MKLFSIKGEVLLVIEEDLPDVGAYLYVYNQRKECTADYLQDDVNACKDMAYTLYGVTDEEWETGENDWNQQ